MLSDFFPVAILLWHSFNLLVKMCSTIKQSFSRIIIMLFTAALWNVMHSSDSCHQRQWDIQNSGHVSMMHCLFSAARHEWTVLTVRCWKCFKSDDHYTPTLCMCLHVVTDCLPSPQAARVSLSFCKSVIAGLLITVCNINWMKQWLLKQSNGFLALIPIL